MTRAHLDVVTQEPFNAHTPADALALPVTPQDRLYVRNHFPVPLIDAAGWRLRVSGAVRQARAWSLDELRALPQREVRAVLECAGNGRTRMRPVPPGTPWGDRAVGCAAFRGPALRDVVEPTDAAVELVFAGADRGVKNGREIAYERSLAVRDLPDDAILALEVNGEPLTPDHGAPARLLVPGWYGFASVKWLAQIHGATEPFQGHFQRDDYQYRQRSDGAPDAPVTRMLVKSLVVAPSDGDRLRAGRPVEIRGWAWSGEAPIERVDVSLDGGATWHFARHEAPDARHAWTSWGLAWTPAAGEHEIVVRARDARGNVQPLDAPWNAMGYGHNQAPRVRVRAG